MPSAITKLLALFRHAYVVLRSPVTPLWVKLSFGLGLGLIVSPFDLIPEWIPIIGVMDDLALAVLLLTWAQSFSITEE